MFNKSDVVYYNAYFCLSVEKNMRKRKSNYSIEENKKIAIRLFSVIVEP